MRRSQLITIFLVVFIVMLGFGVIMPLLPYFAAQYGGSDFLVGLLIASYAAAQFFGAPLLGRLSDRMGRRPVLVISMIGTALGFLLLGLADPIGRGLASALAGGADPARLAAFQNSAVLGVMFLSRIVTGLAGGMITAAQAYMADITDAEHRTMGQGLIGAAFGLGFILGPVAGGILSQFGYATPAFAAAGLAALNVITILGFLPESLTKERKAELAQKKRQPLVSIPAIVRKLGQPGLGPLLRIRLFASLASALFMALFTLWAKGQLGLSIATTSYVMAYQGMLAIVVQIGLIGPLTKRFSTPVLITGGIALQAVGLLMWALSPNVPVLIVAMIPLSLAMAVLNTVINSAITWTVPQAAMGDALGTASALESLSRMVAPPVGGWMLGALGTWSPGVLAATIMSTLTVYAWRRLIPRPVPLPAAPAVAAPVSGSKRR